MDSMNLFLSKRKSPSISWEDRNSDSMVEKLQRVESDSDCASDFKRITISREYNSGKYCEMKQVELSSQDDSQSVGTGETELKSSASWNSVSTNAMSQGSHEARFLPKTHSLSPQSILTAIPQKKEGDFFVKRAIRHLQCWMPGAIRSQSTLDVEISRANQRIASSDLPGNFAFIPVHSSCPMLPIFDYCDIDPIAVSLGASYFQRLLNKKPTMMHAAREAGWFVEVVNDETGEMQTHMRAVYSLSHTGLVVIYATCIYIAAKFADRIKYKRLLSALLFSMLDSYVSEETAVDLEAKCLSKLEWRLGLRTDIP